MDNFYIFGNGNITFEMFLSNYKPIIDDAIEKKLKFFVCDFRGCDTLIMEYLKDKTANVFVYHCFDKPRYLPDKFKTFVSNWITVPNFSSDEERDLAAMLYCDYFFAVDYNSNNKRKSSTLKNIEYLINNNKTLYKI